MATSKDIRARLDQFIYQGEAIAREIDFTKEQKKTSQAEAGIDFLGWAAGELAEYLTELPGIRSPTKKYSKRLMRSRQKNQTLSVNNFFLAKSDYWLNNINDFLKLISVINKNLSPEGNSRQLLRKFNRVRRYVKAETRIRHGISVLKEIQQLNTIKNSEIPKLAFSEIREGYKILQKLETGLRYCIQNKLSSLSKNWWSERVPNDVRNNAAYRKKKNEAQWPWYTKRELSLIHYVDFTDYQKIIARRDNWRVIFKSIFKDKVILTAKLRELEPIRNAIAHNRLLEDDELSRLKLHTSDLLGLIERAE